MALYNIGTHSQRDDRRYAQWFDQHGRPWGGSIEIKTGDPCGGITPEGDWSGRAPLVPPAKYLATVKGQPWALRIDYDGWIAELTEAHQEHQHRLLILMQSKDIATRDKWNQTGELPVDVALYAGAPPPAMEQVKAAKAGHPWVLGREGATRPDWANRVFPPKQTAKDDLAFMADDPQMKGWKQEDNADWTPDGVMVAPAGPAEGFDGVPMLDPKGEPRQKARR